VQLRDAPRQQPVVTYQSHGHAERMRARHRQQGRQRLESHNFPGYYVRHRNGELRVDPYTATDLFRADRSFQPVTAWS
jgi:hypothetical protein